MTESERILERLRRLIALGGSLSTPEEEGRTAAREACRLLLVHKLTVSFEAPAKSAPPAKSARHGPIDQAFRKNGASVVDKDDPAKQPWGNIKGNKSVPDRYRYGCELRKARRPVECFVCTRRFMPGDEIVVHLDSERVVCPHPKPCETIMSGEEIRFC